MRVKKFFAIEQLDAVIEVVGKHVRILPQKAKDLAPPSQDAVYEKP
jgi:hypothetical protein